MIRYKSNNQLKIEEFNTPFETKLDSNNRWVKLSKEIPWDRMASVYYRKLSQNKGAATTDARIVIGALIVKHRMKLSDIDTIEYIRENVYVQYFLGLSAYTYEPVFDPSLFVYIRKRLGVKKFEDMTAFLINKEEKNKDEDENRGVLKGLLFTLKLALGYGRTKLYDTMLISIRNYINRISQQRVFGNYPLC